MADRLGQRLGNYRLIRLLGRGGFADVYLGEHLRLDTQAAIKVLYTRLVSKDDVEEFEKEARIIAHLKHPHIVRVLDYDVEDNTPFLVMDHASGGTLRTRHPKGTVLSLTTIVSHLKQVASALQYAHDQHVIHRDVKPENMLVGEHDELLLSDFGIALLAQSSRYQSAQEMAGTMAYMAPEQIQGKPRPASDQYSLGVVVYEWLTGDRPFHGSLTELVGQHLSVPPPSLQKEISTISPEVDRVVLTALAKDPKERFASVRAFATALEQAYQTATAHPVALTSETPIPSQPLQTTNTVAAIPPTHLSQPTEVITPPSQSLQPINVIAQPNQSQLPTDTVIPSPVVSPSTGEAVTSSESHSLQPSQHRISRRTVIIGLAGLAVVGGSITWLALSHRPQVASPTPRPTATSFHTDTPSPMPTPSGPPLGVTLLTYRGHSGIAVNTVAWSPDGKFIASGGEDGTVQVWDAETGRTIFTYLGHSTSGVHVVVWSPDGTRIASCGWDKTAQIWDAFTGSHPLIYPDHSLPESALAWSPDGTRIGSGGGNPGDPYTTAGNSGIAEVWDAKTGNTLLTYLGHSGFVSTLAWSPGGTRIASGGLDKTVRVWDAKTGNTLLTYLGHSGFVSTLAWSPDGTRIASGGFDQAVKVWDAATGNTTLNSHVLGPVAWSPDGTRIASESRNHTVQVWDAATGSILLTYLGDYSNNYDVNSLQWSPNGKYIASGSPDGTVKVWQAS